MSGRQKSGSGRVRVLDFCFGFRSGRVLNFFSGSGRVRVPLLGFGSGFGFLQSLKKSVPKKNTTTFFFLCVPHKKEGQSACFFGIDFIITLFWNDKFYGINFLQSYLESL